MSLPANMASSRLSVAPMMEWTDRHYRFLARMMTAHTKVDVISRVCMLVRHADTLRGVISGGRQC
jgi:tRNA-dihydrouridine synthase